MSASVNVTDQGVVIISYNELLKNPSSLGASISRAFGAEPDCLGLILVKDLPQEYPELRAKLLYQIHDFAALDETIRDQYSDPTSRFSFGWSHGKEIMNGKPDTLKGSFYATIQNNELSEVSDGERAQFPEYYGENIWPRAPGVEGFETAFKSLGHFILGVGKLLATACQPFVSAQLIDTSVTLLDMIYKSHTTKGRALHYFSPPTNAALHDGAGGVNACGYHLDHSLLTGLCSALYLSHETDGSPKPVKVVSEVSGLYIKTRGGNVVKASFPADCLAFQTGEALEIATGGKLAATPHYVRVEIGDTAVTRETFALFMQPNTDKTIGPGETFGQFSKRIFDEHYQDPRLEA